MEAKRWGLQINERWGGLQLDSRKVFVASKIALLGTLKFEANKFETVGLRAAESFDVECEALIVMIRDRQHAAR